MVNCGGHFFAVDRRAWHQACRLGLNPAVAYLVINRGTAGDNETSAWSTNAIETHTGISRGRSKQALAALIDAGLLSVKRSGTYPLYRVVPWRELMKLAPDEVHVLSHIVFGGTTVPKTSSSSQWGSRRPFNVALTLEKKGLVRGEGDQIFSKIFDYDLEREWVWLPNALVTGAAAEVPPLELLRQSGELLALRLLIDLYADHDLPEHGGINRFAISQSFQRTRVGQQGPFVVWGFSPDEFETHGFVPFVQSFMTNQFEQIAAGRSRDTGWPKFWHALDVLTRLGLVEFVPHIFEGSDSSSEIVHVYAMDNGEEEERALAAAAYVAAESLLTTGQVEKTRENDLWLVPALSPQLDNIQLFGIARLRYRPRTRATAAWLARRGDIENLIRRYELIAKEHGPACNIKEELNVASR